MAFTSSRHLQRRPRTKAPTALCANHRLIVASFCIFLVGFVYYFHPQSIASALSVRSSGTMTSSPVFSLLVTLNFEASEYKEQFLNDIKPVAEYVKSSEPDTVAYEVLLSDKDPLEVLILERYKDKENAYLKVHKSSEPFLAFRPKLQAMQEMGQVKVSGNSYLDSGVGFGDRS
jgi:quinol monooxygenase YgiN